ncbi:putative calcium-activated chloride channel regulator 4-like [Penaeus vannamei]|uniref:Putative calcium-activated chloride channel regulator 4-like n=1 Tax=Penaeus vannamei TaxID=6689 RepID=A0A423U2W9_PENVA|nr:putative calcium-activated chloride channel regulator 4-like [Penaeus vannamei]
MDPAAAQDVPEPRVRVVRERPPGVALVTDVSGSMNEHHRYKRLQRAITRWILRDAPDNTSLAIIRFSDDVQVVQNLTQLDSEATRRALAQSLNCRPAGGTGIGAGLLKAIETVERSFPHHTLAIRKCYPFLSSALMTLLLPPHTASSLLALGRPAAPGKPGRR